MENKFSEHIISFSFILCIFKVILVVYLDVFDEYYIFAMIVDPYQTSFVASLFQNTPCKMKI